MIRHSVIFRFRPQLSLPEQKEFFESAWQLARIPGVQNFDILAQTSPKNNFDYGIVMAFDTPELYEQYTNHPDHVSFVENVWLKAIGDFLEIDYQPLQRP